MEKILGIDLGTNSIGWAIRDITETDNQIIDYGVLRFDKGVAEEKGNEKPKVQERTNARGTRRNYQAAKYRKWLLLECLIKNNMCPLTLTELNKWKHYRIGFNREYPINNKEFIRWLRFDFDGDGKPDFHLFSAGKNESHYLFRANAIKSDSKIKNVYESNPMILGRVFYHLVQRRGFKGRDEEEAKTILEGSEKAGTAGREMLNDFVLKYKSIGAALYHYQKEKGGRIRCRYTLRTDFENEINLICENHNIPEQLRKKILKAVVWQRPLRSQKGLVGLCTFEKNKRRAPISHPLYEEYRTWVFINNLKIQAPKNIDYTLYIEKNILPIFYKVGNDFKLSSILRQVKKDFAKVTSKYAEKGKDKVVSAKILNLFETIFESDWKEKLGYKSSFKRSPKQPKKEVTGNYTYEDIWHVLHTFDSKELLLDFATKKLKLNEEHAQKFAEFNTQQGYATLSLSAIKKILPFLKKGYLYSKAVYLANLQQVLGETDVTDELVDAFATDINEIIENVDLQKQINFSINSLYQKFLVGKDKFQIENDRDLDTDEEYDVTQDLENTFGIKSWDSLESNLKEKIKQEVDSNYLDFLKMSMAEKRSNVFKKNPRLHDEIFKVLQEKYNLSDDRKKYLWHPSEQENYPSAKEYIVYKVKDEFKAVLPNNKKSFLHQNPNAQFEGLKTQLLGKPEPISKGFKNPMALKTLHNLKKLINHLLITGKIDEDTRVVVEIARELNDANKRKAIEKWQRDREKDNDRIIEKIKELKPGYDKNDKTLIRKYRLWEEQGKKCLYTGATIKCTDIFNASKYDLEHTIPASLSFDSELKNLTLADKHYNQQIKQKKIPFDLPNYAKSATIDNIEYSPIKPRFEFIKKKVKHFEDLVKEWLIKTKYASTKGQKDGCIINRHIYKMELEYWKKKLHTFECEEWKAGWKNSQLRDTQIITKYALPYLKTVFRRVEVQKGKVVAAFREIFSIDPKLEKKNRDKHSHHAKDAAVLTLIPKTALLEKILKEYFERKDLGFDKVYHTKPTYYQNFNINHILSIDNKVLINYLPDDRVLVPTYKKVRKRGKIQYQKIKDEYGKWHFKKDKDGNKIPLWAKGDSMRGQLHKESYFGAIKKAKRDEDEKVIREENGGLILDEVPTMVIRKPLKFKKGDDGEGFKSLEEINDCIVDLHLFEMIKKQVNQYNSFEDILNEGIFFLDKKGNRVNKIRHIRCKVKAGRRFFTFDKALQLSEHSYVSKSPYKNYHYAKMLKIFIVYFMKVTKQIN